MRRCLGLASGAGLLVLGIDSPGLLQDVVWMVSGVTIYRCKRGFTPAMESREVEGQM